MKKEIKTTDFQGLNLEKGGRASCRAGYPKMELIVVACIKDFEEAPDPAYLINNASEFIKVIYGSATTSHYISNNWLAGDARMD